MESRLAYVFASNLNIIVLLGKFDLTEGSMSTVWTFSEQLATDEFSQIFSWVLMDNLYVCYLWLG